MAATMLAEDVAPLRAMARTTATQNVAAIHASLSSSSSSSSTGAGAGAGAGAMPSEAAVADTRAKLDQARIAARHAFDAAAPGHTKKQALLGLLVARYGFFLAPHTSSFPFSLLFSLLIETSTLTRL